MTLKEVAEEWFFANISTLSYGYQTKVKCSLEHIYAAMGKKNIKNIKPIDIDKLLIGLTLKNPHTGRPSAKSTLKSILQITKSVFEYAQRNEIIKCNPAQWTKISKSAPTTARRALTEEEQKIVLSVNHRAVPAVLIMMFAGLRKGEVIALKWSDIDFNKKTISVDKSAQRTAPNQFTVTAGTKNGKCRKVIMPDILIDKLAAYYNTASSPLICPKTDGSLHTPTTWKKMWDSYQNELNHFCRKDKSRSKFNPNGIEQKLDKITAHMLRHTYDTMLYNAGVDVKTAAKLLGHSDIETTLKIYTHLEQEKEDFSIAEFEKYVNNRFVDNLVNW